MNLRYTLLATTTFMVAGGAMAQRITQRPAMMDFRPAVQQHVPANLPASGDQRGGGPVFSEDFANGLAGNNGVGPWTLEGPNGNIWKRATNGPNGAYTQTSQRIASTTVANGYMLFASDSANTDWSVNPPVIVANPVNWEGSLVSPLLDLSATPYVEIEFQQRQRYCCQSAPHYLEISTDGGTTWSTIFPTTAGIAGNQDPGTQTKKFNISAAIAANPANVKFRFRHSADAGSSHYHWQIDDVKINELAPYDLRVESAAITSWNASTAATWDSCRYTVFPHSQLRPLGLNMTLLNNGSEAQDDVVANFTVTRDGTTVLDQDQDVPNFEPGEVRTVFVNPSFTPPAVDGTYNVDFSVTSGAEDPTADNTGSDSFKVEEFVYARDNGSYAGFEDGNADGTTLIVGNAFYVKNSALLYSIDVAFGSQSELDAVVQGELRDGSEFEVLNTTEEYYITSSMLNGTGGSNFTRMIFPTPVQLNAGTDYLVTVQVFGAVRIGLSGTSPAQSSFIYYISPTQGENWFYTTTTPMVRMGFDPSVGIEENDRTNGVGLGQNLPNPATGVTSIPYELKEAANVSFQVHDMNGKLVMERFEGKRAAGAYRMELDTESLPEGMYTYTLVAGDVRLTKRMAVIH
jgi:hypothetical protein